MPEEVITAKRNKEAIQRTCCSSSGSILNGFFSVFWLTDYPADEPFQAPALDHDFVHELEDRAIENADSS
ncbi:hypothetical protein [Paenibacillus jiagnxiensis]|uniref:hypothetical protein n=1 Tax=Paenibacillus jiagnxiensis TaxID=3228926 RepID=UPI0033A84111